MTDLRKDQIRNFLITKYADGSNYEPPEEFIEALWKLTMFVAEAPLEENLDRVLALFGNFLASRKIYIIETIKKLAEESGNKENEALNNLLTAINYIPDVFLNNSIRELIESFNNKGKYK